MSRNLRLSSEIELQAIAARRRGTWQPANPSATPLRPKADAESRPNSRTARPDAASRATLYPLVGLCRAARLPLPTPEVQFHPGRRWRADYCWQHTDPRVIVEIDGGIWTQGRHTRGKGYLADLEKLNAATLLGFAILRYAPDQLERCIADLTILFGRKE